MTDKKITCKYKFQDEDHYNGSPYCTLFNERCKDLDFICDENCEVFDDCKELQRKTAECEELKEQLEKNRKLTLEYISSGDKYLKALDEIFKVLFDEICSSNPRCDGSDCDDCSIYTVLNIIKKAKGAEND